MLAAICLGCAGRADAQFGALVSPGKLAKGHAALEGISNCQKCHEQGQRVTAAKCLVCHQPVADRISRKVGVHKDVKNECSTCHAEHGGVDGELRPFDPAKFDHTAVTGFPLTGKHAPSDKGCAACHKVRSFMTLSSSCVSCHADVHKGAFGPNCTSCHSTQTPFKQISGQFDHTKARFQLVGAHAKVACAACHVNNQFKGIPFAACTDCHRDVHAKKFGPTCTTCHTNDTWRTKNIDHSKTAFPLAGSHVKVDCAACHKQPSMKVKPKSDTCAACHVDVHRGTFKQDCKACHNETSWSKAPFDHSQTKFQLTGKHQGLDCVKCHTNVSTTARVAANRVADYRGLKTECVSCHADVHQPTLGVTCETCHTSSTFKVTTFRHARFPDFFAGQHAPVACAKCHEPAAPTRPVRTGVVVVANFKSAPTTCVSCHKDVHLGQESGACETCHTVQAAKWVVPAFAHDTRTSFALTGKHATTACEKCHKSETGTFPAGTGTAIRLKGVGKECRACHADVHLGQVSDRCEACHGTASFKVASYKHLNKSLSSSFFVGSHVKAACIDCHKPFTGKFPKGTGTAVRFAIDAKCVACHQDVHRGSLGPNCANCHRP